MFRRRWFALILPWLALFPLVLAGPALQAAHEGVLNVNQTVDVPDANPGDGVCDAVPNNHICTLRAAIQEASANPNPDTINIPAGTYNLLLSGVEDGGVAGDLDITGTTTLIGAGAATTIIDASAIDDRVMQVHTGTVSIEGVTLQHGTAQLSGGGLWNKHGNTILANSIITGNQVLGVSANGGGIYNTARLVILHTQVSSNSVESTGISSYGGGIFHFGASLVLSASLVSNNVAVSSTSTSGDGGGINIGGTGPVTITNSTINGNRARWGGGINNEGYQTNIVNSTLAGNTARFDGGGIANLQGNISLYNVTVVGNVANTMPHFAQSGGGVFNDGGATFKFLNTIIAGNFIGNLPNLFLTQNECRGTLISLGANFVGVPTCPISGTAPLTGNPLLGGLGYHGGPTPTFSLLPGSPAIDAGDPGGCTDPLGAPLTTDQRGFARPLFGGCDLGAFEVEFELFLPLTPR